MMYRQELAEMNQKTTLFSQLSVSLTLGLVVIAALTLTACNKEEVEAKPAPVEVQAIKVEPKTVPVTVSFVAQVESSHQVEIMARVSGFLEKIQKIHARQLPVRHRTNYDLCRLWLLTEVEGFPFNTHLLILDPLQGFQISLPNLIFTLTC